MPSFKLLVEYDGSSFNGFQRQIGTAMYHAKSSNNTNADSTATSNATLDNNNNTANSGKKRKRSSKDNQNKVRTVQGCLEEALVKWVATTYKYKVTVPELRLRCAGRTDKGVHATGQIVAFDLPEQQEETKEMSEVDHGGSLSLSSVTSLSSWQIQRAINSRLPSDIAIRHVSSCASTFEPRQCVKQKTYTYRLRYRRKVWISRRTNSKNSADNAHKTNEINHQQQQSEQQLHPLCNGGGPQTLRSPHDPSCLWICPWPLDDCKIESICNGFQGSYDFSCFVHKSDRTKKDNTIHLDTFKVEYLQEQQQYSPPEETEDNDEKGNIVTNTSTSSSPSIVDVLFTLQANGFRRSMVRNLIGFVVDVMRGQVLDEDIPKVLLKDGGSNDKVTTIAKLIHSAPASGLCLAKVAY
mmetsp:Transcript_1230/g.1670  ORF Transcript_1230/g.1670 Transcript_1230/m.1670 type:complete len:410 (+) Transcript_1230:123-1352(+)